MITSDHQPSKEESVVTRTVTLELPEDLVSLLGSPEEAATIAKEVLVLELLRKARISQGKAAHLLGLTRWELLDLMAVHEVPSGPENAEEARQEIEEARRFLKRG